MEPGIGKTRGGHAPVSNEAGALRGAGAAATTIVAVPVVAAEPAGPAALRRPGANVRVDERQPRTARPWAGTPVRRRRARSAPRARSGRQHGGEPQLRLHLTFR